MDKYQDKEAAKDDYSHEKKLGADARWDMEHGHGDWAGDDIDHAHALKKDAHHDATSRREEHGYDASAHKVLKHSWRNKGINFDSSTDKGISTLYTGERKGE